MSPSTNNFCLFCYKSSGLSTKTADNFDTIEHFYKLLGRFSEGSDVSNLIQSTEKLFNTSLHCCVKCQDTIDEFCAVYHKFKFLELQLDKNLCKLVSTVQLANRIPTRWRNLSEIFDTTFNNDIERKRESQAALRKLRQTVVKAGHLRSVKSQPRVKINSIKGNCSHHCPIGTLGQITSHDDKIDIELPTDNNNIDTLPIFNDPSIITKTEQIQHDEPEHPFEHTWHDYEQAIPEPPSSLLMSSVFTELPVVTENNPFNSTEIMNDSSLQTDCDISTITVSALKQSHRYGLRENRRSKISRDNDSESYSDERSDTEDILSNYDDNTDESDGVNTNKPETENNGCSDGVVKRFSVPGRKRARQCDECAIWLKNRQALHAHKIKYHRDPVKCPVCKKSYSRADNLNRHVLSLHGNSEYAIEFRNKVKMLKQVVARNRRGKVQT